MNVFLVEDSPNIRSLIRLCIESIGGRIAGEADSQQQAITEVCLLKPDIVIIDLWLREGSGFTVIQALKAQLPNMIQIVLSGQKSSQMKAVCLKHGADYYFEKSASGYVQLEQLLKGFAERYVKS